MTDDRADGTASPAPAENAALSTPPAPVAATFASRAFEVAGRTLVADRSGALYIPTGRTLVVADLHFEKGSAFASRGLMLPPYDTRETMARLAEVLPRYTPRRVVALGDSLHDRSAGDRLGSRELECLRALQSGLEWIWVTGNHDPEIGAGLGGHVVSEIAIDGFVLRHAPVVNAPPGEISGHLHPAARVALNGLSLRSRCFAASDSRLVLPAFGAFTGGLNVLDTAFAPFFGGTPPAVLLLGRDGVYPVAGAILRPD
jgi:DNA ligase-associated metallophosphoesterase